ncbi:hypothetical protein Tco_0771693 [Tanacetum coccineum]|uniref:Uncharacterized protein n=1 Tax=Tanacetum coccineum TaxID=301880 RepID=A0ABQ4ZGV4_9ASTR
MRILSVTSVTIDKCYGYGHLKEIVIFNLEGDIIVDLAAALRIDGTLKSVHDIIHDRLMNFKLGYNKDMDRRKWTETDKRRTHIMIKKIDEQMLERRFMRSFKKFIGGREYGTAVRLLQRTI